MASPTQSENIALIKQDISYIKQSVQDISINIHQNYTPIGDFNTLKNRVDAVHKILAYLASLVALAIIAAVMKMVLK